jgi:hypothetical protein
MIEVPTSAAEAVANGAQMLDEHEPGWWQRISLDDLLMSSCSNCVCGQIAEGHYDRGLSRYMDAVGWGITIIPHGYGRAKHSFAVVYGFDHPDVSDSASRRWSYPELHSEWKQAIVARLVADKIVAPRRSSMASKKNIIEKTCTKTGETFVGTQDELAEFFYRDKSQKDGLSPWCKAAEKAYNKAYYAGLKKAKAPKKALIATPKNKKAFEDVMAPERVARKSKVVAKATAKRDGTRTTQAPVEVPEQEAVCAHT